MLVQSYHNQEELNNIFKPKIKNNDSLDSLMNPSKKNLQDTESERTIVQKNNEGFEIPKIQIPLGENMKKTNEIFDNPDILKLIIGILLIVVVYLLFQINSLKLEKNLIFLTSQTRRNENIF